ncbi:hypothetical protein BDA99DRAFT_504943, partial [Phascolomyces articulosus]
TKFIVIILNMNMLQIEQRTVFVTKGLVTKRLVAKGLVTKGLATKELITEGQCLLARIVASDEKFRQ